MRVYPNSRFTAAHIPYPITVGRTAARIVSFVLPVSFLIVIRVVVEAMGLRKLGKTVIMPDNDATRGMIRKVGFMLKVEEA